MTTVSIPFMVNKNVTAHVRVSLKVSQEMRYHAEQRGVGPEELENLLGQRFDEIVDAVKDALQGIEYVPSPHLD